MDNNLNIQISEYLNTNWNQILDDMRSLISIPSSANDGETNSEFPNGTGACKAMEAALDIAKRMGFDVHNHKNVIGIADYKGQSDTQIGFISHCDVVPPGPDWHFNPYELNEVDDYLIGRGVLDDKGPTVIFLHALNFWIQNGYKFPYSVRYLFGTDEETDSSDIECFKKDFDQPKIIISPDADFPICYGEKGILRFKITSKKFENPQISNINAGGPNNAVAGLAYAIFNNQNLWVKKEDSRLAHAIFIKNDDDGNLKITAKGRSAHAACPYDGIDSIAVLSQFLLEKNLGSKDEQMFLKFLTKIAGKPNGNEIGIESSDEHFESLTIVPSILKLNDGCWEQTFDVRYPLSITADQILDKIKAHMPDGCKITLIKNSEPFIINPKSKLIDALSRAYTEVTGNDATKFTMGGATYARDFDCGTSFGPMMNWIATPAWVGTLHGPDEGVSVKTLQDSFNIYVYAIKYLMELDLDTDEFIKDIKSV